MIYSASEALASNQTVMVSYIEDISWPRGDTNFIFEC